MRDFAPQLCLQMTPLSSLRRFSDGLTVTAPGIVTVCVPATFASPRSLEAHTIELVLLLGKYSFSGTSYS